MIHNWAFQWEMNFNPDRTKESPHPRLMFKR